MKLCPGGSLRAKSIDSRAGEPRHSRAQVYKIDTNRSIRTQERTEKSPIAIAADERSPAVRHVVDIHHAARLQRSSKCQIFRRPIKRRDLIAVHCRYGMCRSAVDNGRAPRNRRAVHPIHQRSASTASAGSSNAISTKTLSPSADIRSRIKSRSRINKALTAIAAPIALNSPRSRTTGVSSAAHTASAIANFPDAKVGLASRPSVASISRPRALTRSHSSIATQFSVQTAANRSANKKNSHRRAPIRDHAGSATPEAKTPPTATSLGNRANTRPRPRCIHAMYKTRINPTGTAGVKTCTSILVKTRIAVNVATLAAAHVTAPHERDGKHASAAAEVRKLAPHLSTQTSGVKPPRQPTAHRAIDPRCKSARPPTQAPQSRRRATRLPPTSQRPAPTQPPPSARRSSKYSTTATMAPPAPHSRAHPKRVPRCERRRALPRRPDRQRKVRPHSSIFRICPKVNCEEGIRHPRPIQSLARSSVYLTTIHYFRVAARPIGHILPSARRPAPTASSHSLTPHFTNQASSPRL
jgi:hypothetical protein